MEPLSWGTRRGGFVSFNFPPSNSYTTSLSWTVSVSFPRGWFPVGRPQCRTWPGTRFGDLCMTQKHHTWLPWWPQIIYRSEEGNKLMWPYGCLHWLTFCKYCEQQWVRHSCRSKKQYRSCCENLRIWQQSCQHLCQFEFWYSQAAHQSLLLPQTPPPPEFSNLLEPKTSCQEGRVILTFW